MQFESSYLISDYGRKAPFSSFLPGVAGERGIPLWCFYVNRGQGIAGFGSRDKHHSIMEFCPANTAYQRVQTIGFRTFLKVDGKLLEPFADGRGDMLISENALTIQWVSPDQKINVEVRYFIVPNTRLGTLARRVCITNLSAEPIKIEVLDGLSAIVPFGLEQHPLKMMGQTAKAWMMVEGLDRKLPYFRLRSSLADTTSVEPIEDGSYGAACINGNLLPVIVDPAVIFDWDTSFALPMSFCAESLQSLLTKRQRTENELPCCFFSFEQTLESSAQVRMDSIYGLSHGQEQLARHVDKLFAPSVLDRKEQEACLLLDPYVRAIETHTADPAFDSYCRQSYIDNFLRGGVPTVYTSGEKKQLFYLYSRKHGDLERDYNEFVVTPEYASQGNGNFRDVLQNRRSDVRFCPAAGWEPLKPFLELIQADGYNPLVIQPASFTLREDAQEQWKKIPQLKALLQKDFTPGALLKVLEETNLSGEEQDQMFCEILCCAKPQVNADFAEGYWIDHWIYLLDLLESYLSIYPEKQNDVLNERCLRWYESRATVLPLEKRCIKARGELRQHNALDHQKKQNTAHSWMLNASGNVVLSTPLEKLFMLCVLKFASLDASGEAVSMEAGKPGWYDALNGLPALFGSSTAESSELWRTLHFIRNAISSFGSVLQLPAEMASFARRMAQTALLSSAYDRWHTATPVLEAYRERTAFGVSAEEIILNTNEALSIVDSLLACVSGAVSAMLDTSSSVVPTYFTNLPTEWTETEEGILPKAFDHKPLPPFLEGTVHALRLPIESARKKTLIEKVRSSSLWDEKLHMYKVSADLSGETPELGRANAFTRGWLEHESIWLHMEYKYLLEMLKNGFYDTFFEAFSDALIPFQPSERYGRSILENSSFLASSANPDPGTHGRGFVARLSGATAEFLEMWQTMFFGAKPFEMKDGMVVLSLKPALPARLIPDHGVVSAMFLGCTQVVYHFPASETITPDTHSPSHYLLCRHDGTETEIRASYISNQDALDVRNGKIRTIHVFYHV